MGDFKSVNILNRPGNVPLAHPSCVHGQYLIFDSAHVPCSFWDRLGLKGGFPVPGDIDGDVAVSGFERLAAAAVAAVLCVFRAMVIGAAAQVGVHLPLKHRFKHGAEDVLDCVQDFFFGSDLDFSIPALRMQSIWNSG